MSLPRLTFRKLPTVSMLTSSGVNNILDYIYSGFASNIYADGSPRNTGIDYAWSAIKFGSGTVQNTTPTECVVCTPPISGNSGVYGRIIFAGTSTTGTAYSPTPTMLRDTFLKNTLYTSVNKYQSGCNSGTYTGWSNALPFSATGAGGKNGGYTQLLSSGTLISGNIDYMNIWESYDTFFLQFLSATADNTYSNARINGMGYFGAICDPESSNTTYDSEIDGKLYGLAIGGNVSGLGGNNSDFLCLGDDLTSSLASNSTKYFYNWNTTGSTVGVSAPIFYCLVPGTGAFGSQALFSKAMNTYNSNNNFITLTRNNTRGQIPLMAANDRTVAGSIDFQSPAFLGRIRETDMCLSDSINDIVVRDTGNNVLGYVVGVGRTSALGGSIFLPYV